METGFRMPDTGWDGGGPTPEIGCKRYGYPGQNELTINRLHKKKSGLMVRPEFVYNNRKSFFYLQ